MPRECTEFCFCSLESVRQPSSRSGLLCLCGPRAHVRAVLLPPRHKAPVWSDDTRHRRSLGGKRDLPVKTGGRIETSTPSGRARGSQRDPPPRAPWTNSRGEVRDQTIRRPVSAKYKQLELHSHSCHTRELTHLFVSCGSFNNHKSAEYAHLPKKNKKLAISGGCPWKMNVGDVGCLRPEQVIKHVHSAPSNITAL